MAAKIVLRAGWALVLAAALALGRHAPAQAAGVVGNGTPGSCTYSALQTAVAGGGLVTFNCGTAPHTIVFNGFIEIAVPTEIDGGGRVTLSGSSASSLFQVFVNRQLTLRNIHLTAASGVLSGFGAIENYGLLRLENAAITASQTPDSGGAVRNLGTLDIADSRLADNSAAVSGGAIYNLGTLLVSDSLLEDNQAEILGGAVYHNGVQATFTGTRVLANEAGVAANNSGQGGGFYIADGKAIAFSAGEISGNAAVSRSDGLGSLSEGGGIHNQGTLTLQQTVLSNNQAYRGGAIFNVGTAGLSDTTFTGNRAQFLAGGDGGAIFNVVGPLKGSRISFRDNQAGATGGAIYNLNASVTLDRFEISGNRANGGGGVNNLGSLVLERGIFEANTAGTGAGLETSHPASSAFLINVTLSGNHNTEAVLNAGSAVHIVLGSANLKFVTIINHSGAPAIGIQPPNQGTALRISNTVLARNFVNCNEKYPSYGFNLSDDSSCDFDQAGDQDSTDGQLGLLVGSGFLRAHAPLPGSPLVNASPCNVDISTDQRGTPRPFGTSCDIGAVEYVSGALLPAAYLPLVRR